MNKALLRLNFAVILWAFTGPLGKLISLNEGLLVWYRLAISVLIIGVVLLFTRKRWHFQAKDFLKVGSIGIILALHWLCFFGAIKYSNVSIALTCLASSGLITSIAEPLFFKQKISPISIFLGMFTVAGIALIYQTDFQYAKGITIGMIATVLSVTLTLLNKKTTQHINTNYVTIYQLVGGFIGLTVLMPLYLHFTPTAHLLPTHSDWLWLVVLALLCTVVAFLLFMSSFKFLNAFTINIIMNLEPVYGIFLAILFLHENKSLTTNFYCGLGLIALAVVSQIIITTRQANQKKISIKKPNLRPSFSLKLKTDH